MLTLTAAFDVHVSVTDWPAEEMLLGEAVSVTAMADTVTVAVAVVLPPGPCAVAV